jgi:polar amino acid transport system substrate-binding protein
LLPAIASAQTAPLRVLALDAPPQASSTDGRGIMTDAVMEALKRAGLSGKIEFIPWKRAQEEVQAGKDLLITCLSRNAEREDKYTWLIPVFTLDRAFASTGKQVANFAEAKTAFKHIAVGLGSAPFDQLTHEGFSADQLSTIANEKQDKIPSMLLAGNVDAWFSSVAEIKYALKGQADAGKVVVGPTIGTGSVQFVACSKNCNADLVAKLKKAGEEMIADGTMKAIVAKYQ